MVEVPVGTWFKIPRNKVEGCVRLAASDITDELRCRISSIVWVVVDNKLTQAFPIRAEPLGLFAGLVGQEVFRMFNYDEIEVLDELT